MKLSIIYFIAILLGFVAMGYLHEQVHVEIYKSYGIEARTEFFTHFPDLVTIAEEPCPTESCELAHHINEAIGYPLQIFYILISLGFLLTINSNEMRE